MNTIFTVRPEDLARLNPQRAVDVFRQLLWAEARRIGAGINKIHISGWIDVPDGGVDASVEGNTTLTQSDLIKISRTSYQIKTGRTFKPWQPSQIKKELFGKKNPSKQNLSSSVRSCLDNNGTYVLVCFEQDPTDKQHTKVVEILEDYFKKCEYRNPNVEVWGQTSLIGFLTIFPSLALEINGRGGLRFQSHKSWSQDAEMKRGFVKGQAQKDFILSMQNELRKNTDAIHIRIWGEPGIGKTRHVLEATSAEDLQPFVIYCDTANKFRDSDLMNEILRDDNQFCTILVIDECDPDCRSYIWGKLKYRGSRIKIISIYNEYDKTTGNINYLNTLALDDEQIKSIIQGYGILRDQANRWVDFCSGSPRVAHVLGENLRHNPEDLLKPPDTVNVWDRHIVGSDDPRGQEVKQRRVVLQHIALFKKFGFGIPVVDEAQAIQKIVAKANPQITWDRFQEIVQNLKNRKILQGEYILYITPKLLHIKLWIEWWNTYGKVFSIDDYTNLVNSLPATLIEYFHEMFKYAKESEIASKIVKDLLGENGLFRDEN